LFAAALFFDGIHFLISGTAFRGKIVGLIGERPFQGLFSLMSLIGIVWLSRAYGQAEYFQLWGKPQALRPVALIVMLALFSSLFSRLPRRTQPPWGVELCGLRKSRRRVSNGLRGILSSGASLFGPLLTWCSMAISLL